MIRLFQASDKPAILTIFDQNTPQFFAEEERDHLDFYLDRFGNSYLCCIEDGKIVGGAGYQFLEDFTIGSITWILFDPDHAGKGLGKELMAFAENILLKEPRLQMFRIRTSQLVTGFFIRLGYAVVDVKKDYWAPGFDLVIVEKGK